MVKYVRFLYSHSNKRLREAKKKRKKMQRELFLRTYNIIKALLREKSEFNVIF